MFAAAIASRSRSASVAIWARYQSTSPSSLASAARRSSVSTPAVVADHLLDLLGDLAGLAAQARGSGTAGSSPALRVDGRRP